SAQLRPEWTLTWIACSKLRWFGSSVSGPTPFNPPTFAGGIVAFVRAANRHEPSRQARARSATTFLAEPGRPTCRPARHGFATAARVSQAMVRPSRDGDPRLMIVRRDGTSAAPRDLRVRHRRRVGG